MTKKWIIEAERAYSRVEKYEVFADTVQEALSKYEDGDSRLHEADAYQPIQDLNCKRDY